MFNIKHVYELVKTKVSMLFLTSLCPDV